MRSSRVMAFNLRLVASRHLRLSATASKALVLVSINDLQWVDDTDGRVAFQQVNAVKSGLALDVDQVLEVPAHEEVDAPDGAGGDVPGIVLILGWHDAMRT